MSQLAFNISQRLFSLDVFRGLTTFLLMGTNSILIYLFSETVAAHMVPRFRYDLDERPVRALGFSEQVIAVLNALLVLFIFWYITYFLDKQKVYLKCEAANNPNGFGTKH